MDEIKDFLKSRSPWNLAIVFINIAVFIVLEIMGDTESAQFMAEHGASYTPFVLEEGEYYRLFTCMFLHFGVEHLLSNMLVLIFLGDMLEKYIGHIKYLLIYLIGGLAGNVVSMLLELRSGEYYVSAGASGAIFAVIGALLYMVLRNKGKLADLSGRRLILMIVLSVFQGYSSFGVDGNAHLGGLIGGFLLAVLLYHRKDIIRSAQRN